jgi:hypothetical protein
MNSGSTSTSLIKRFFVLDFNKAQKSFPAADKKPLDIQAIIKAAKAKITAVSISIIYSHS